MDHPLVYYIYHNYYGTAATIPDYPVIETKPYSFTETGTTGQVHIVGNIGKDIGGKLFGFYKLLSLDITPEYIVLLHDKKSPQVVDGEEWRVKLSKPFGTKRKIEKWIDLLQKDPNIGMICATGAVSRLEDQGEQGHYGFSNKELIHQLADKYQIRPENEDFVAGTMFLARYAPYKSFFQKVDPLKIRSQCESKNVLDYDMPSYAHAWERLLSWIVTSQGLTIKEV